MISLDSLRDGYRRNILILGSDDATEAVLKGFARSWKARFRPVSYRVR